MKSFQKDNRQVTGFAKAEVEQFGAFGGLAIQKIKMSYSVRKSLRIVYLLLIAGILLVSQSATATLSFAQTPAKAELSKTEFEIIEGKFHDGLGTFAELSLANEIIKAAKLEQQLFATARAELKMREAINALPASHASRSVFPQEIASIQKATRQGAALLLNKIAPFRLLQVRHTAHEFADAKAGDLRLEFADREALPVSVKTDKSKKVAVAEGQTPLFEEKWAKRYFNVSNDELHQLIGDLGFESMSELKKYYLNVSRLVAEILIRKLQLTDCTPTDFRKARLGDLQAMKFLLRQLRFYKSGNDRSQVIILDRSTGEVKWESLVDEIGIETLTADRISFLPGRPRGGKLIASEFGIKIDGRTVVSFQIKHRRGKYRNTAQQFEFSDITTRLRI
ncbi:MAG: hypothetical protein AB1757_10280 [Acidobacteriota bacterium]